MTTILITGGAGFIGSHVAEGALECGDAVRVLDSLRPDVHGGEGCRLRPHRRLEVVRGDLLEAGLDAILDGVDVVCHQAAKVGLGVDLDDAPDYALTNDVGTAALLASMARTGVDALVLASSMVVYGEGAYRDALGPVAAPPRDPEDLRAGRFEPRSPRTGEPLAPALVTEDAPLDPRNVYAASKVAQEHYASAWARATGGRVAALRYHNVYGPHMPADTPYAGVASIFRSALERGVAPTVLEDGLQRRDFVHVRDVAAANLAAIDWALLRPPGAVRAFNVASGEARTIGEMARALCDAFGGPDPVVTGGFRLGDVRHVTASNARAVSELGWRPRVPFAEGMREFASAPLRAPARARAAIA